MTEIVLLTKNNCHFCEQAKAVLARVGAEYELRVTERPLESEEGRRLAERSGALFPPVVLLDGEPFSYGRLSERRLRKSLAR